MSRFTFFNNGHINPGPELPIADPVSQTDEFPISKEARYRVEQQNLMKIDGNIISSSLLKRQYHLMVNTNSPSGFVKMEESHLNLGNTTLKELGYFINKTDELKDEIQFNLDTKGTVLKITNEEYLKNKWEYFKSTGILKDPFIKELNDFDPAKVRDIISAGDLEYADFDLIKTNLGVNLFYSIVLDQYLFSKEYAEFNYEDTTTKSHLFNTTIDLAFKHSIVSENEDTFTLQKSSKMLYANLHDIAMEYEKNYQPTIQYAFTNYDYSYEHSVIINKRDGLIDSALASITETVKNNLESIVLFKLTRVSL